MNIGLIDVNKEDNMTYSPEPIEKVLKLEETIINATRELASYAHNKTYETRGCHKANTRLGKEVRKLKDENEKLKRKLNAATADIEPSCQTCKHYKCEEICRKCYIEEYYYNRGSEWHWHGVDC